MRKILIIFVAAICSIITSCKCSNTTPVNVTETNLNVENVISTDRQAMFLNHSNDYRWYETSIKLKDWLDEESDGTIDEIVNVFQVVETQDSICFDTFIYKYQHFSDGTVNEDTIHNFWIEDWPLEEEAIQVTFREAFEKVMEVNLPKPHTHNVVLRKEVGPNICNPQWIFGNLHSQIYVDAVTGEVSDESPAFKGLNLGTPLGEWP